MDKNNPLYALRGTFQERLKKAKSVKAYKTNRAFFFWFCREARYISKLKRKIVHF